METATKPATFADWMRENLAEDMPDIVNHGVEGGFSGLIYTSECVELFDTYADEIWAMAVEMAEDLGCENVATMIAGFNRSDMLADYDQFRNLMVWFAAEEIARRECPDA